MSFIEIDLEIKRILSGQFLEIYYKHHKTLKWSDDLDCPSIYFWAREMDQSIYEIYGNLNFLRKAGLVRLFSLDYCSVQPYYNRYDPAYPELVKIYSFLGAELCQ